MYIHIIIMLSFLIYSGSLTFITFPLTVILFQHSLFICSLRNILARLDNSISSLTYSNTSTHTRS